MSAASATSIISKKRADVLKLREVRHKYAKKALRFAYDMLTAATALNDIEAQIHKESMAIAGENYAEIHTVSFDMYGSIEQQIDNDCGEVLGPGMKDVQDFAQSLIEELEPVAASDPLPFEA
jgi:hypothetical protein